MSQQSTQNGAGAIRFRSLRIRRSFMKRALIFLLTMYAVVTSADELKVSQPAPGEVIHVATALDHLTVLEFGEPVTMAAAGSPAFQIERHEDKVFIKPLKAGVSTDLFVWTASRRFAYELEPPGEVKNMNFAVDNRIPAPKPVARQQRTSGRNCRHDVHACISWSRARGLDQHQGCQRPHHRPHRACISVPEHSLHSLFNSESVGPAISSDHADNCRGPCAAATISVMSFHHVQLDDQTLRRLGELRERPLSLARAEVEKEDLQPGEETQGVVAIREQVVAPTIFQLTFGPLGSSTRCKPLWCSSMSGRVHHGNRDAEASARRLCARS